MTFSSGAKPYEILSPLCEGGMGEVHKAPDTRLERQKTADADSDCARYDAGGLASRTPKPQGRVRVVQAQGSISRRVRGG